MTETTAAKLRSLATREATAMPPGWPDAHKLYSDAADELDRLVQKNAELRDALSAHHEWHQAQTEENEHGFSLADGYADSTLADITVSALRAQ